MRIAPPARLHARSSCSPPKEARSNHGRPVRSTPKLSSLLRAILAGWALSICTVAIADGLITGRASVVDGDTIDIRGERIRLDGIDAPESWQRCDDARGRSYPCGRAAAAALDAFLAAARPTRCEYVQRDRYGRFVATCFRADGADVNRWLVRQGHALDWPRYSRGKYADAQRQAQRARTGMWQGKFVEPWEARRLRRGGT